jgi:DNA replication protein DnaC
MKDIQKALDAIYPNEQKVCKYCGKPYTERHLKTKFFTKTFYVANCDCAEKEEMRKQQIEETIAHKRELRKRLKDANFPYDTSGKRLKSRTCENVKIAREYIANFQPRQRQGLYFVGSVGNAKTTLAVCIGKELILRGYKVKFIVFSQAIRKLQSTYGTKNPLDFMEQVEEFGKYDLLIFDDFGREAYKDRTLTDVADFVNYLYTNKNNVIITSNPEMVEKVKEIPDFNAMFDRFFQMTRRVNFKNSSYRRGQVCN